MFEKRMVEIDLPREGWKEIDRLMEFIPENARANSIGMLLTAGLKFNSECYKKGVNPITFGRYLAGEKGE